MDPFTFFGKLLDRLDPKLVGVVPVAAVAEKFFVDGIKKLLGDKLKGNVVQTVTAVLSLASTLLGAWGTGFFETKHTWMGWSGLFFVAILCYLGAVGINETLTDKG